MTSVVSLFGAQGGVGKTTTTFNLGLMLAGEGKRVLFVDADPLCSLTGGVLSLRGSDTADEIRGNRDGRPLNIWEGLAPAFESRPTLLKPVLCVPLPQNNPLFLMPGHFGLAEYEVPLGIAQELSGSLSRLRNLPGSLRYLIELTAAAYDIEIVIVDMAPRLGAFNQNLISISD